MSNNFETGHAKNVANFDEVIVMVDSLGVVYNPANAALKVPALKTQSTDAKASITAVNNAIPSFSLAIADRDLTYDPLGKVTTRIFSALKASGITQHVIDDARTLVRKIQGRRATPKMSEAAKTEAAANGNVVVEISSSQMSFDNRLNNFDKLIKLLSSVPLYSPNEADLKITALIALYNVLKAKNSAVLAAEPALTNARILRNDLLYKENTGLVDIALSVKAYIKSVYGASSPQYKKISSIKFTKKV